MPIVYRGSGRTARRGSRADRLAKPPLHWMNQQDLNPDHRLWGDREAQSARVKGRTTRIKTPAQVREESAREATTREDAHPARRDEGRVEIAPAGTLNWLAKKVPLFNRRHGG